MIINHLILWQKLIVKTEYWNNYYQIVYTCFNGIARCNRPYDLNRDFPPYNNQSEMSKIFAKRCACFKKVGHCLRMGTQGFGLIFL